MTTCLPCKRTCLQGGEQAAAGFGHGWWEYRLMGCLFQGVSFLGETMPSEVSEQGIEEPGFGQVASQVGAQCADWEASGFRVAGVVGFDGLGRHRDDFRPPGHFQ